MKWVLSVCLSFTVLAAGLSALWIVGFAATVSPWPPQIRSAPLVVRINRWPQSCIEVVTGGEPLEYVTLDLGFRHTAWRDLEEFGVDWSRHAFEDKVRRIVMQRRALVALDIGATPKEKAVAMAEMSLALSPSGLDKLHRNYVVANAKVTGVDPLYTLNWLLTLTLPPVALMALGWAMRSGTGRPRDTLT